MTTLAQAITKNRACPNAPIPKRNAYKERKNTENTFNEESKLYI